MFTIIITLIVDIKTQGLTLLPLCTSNGVYISGKRPDVISSDTLQLSSSLVLGIIEHCHIKVGADFIWVALTSRNKSSYGEEDFTPHRKEAFNNQRSPKWKGLPLEVVGSCISLLASNNRNIFSIFFLFLHFLYL